MWSDLCDPPEAIGVSREIFEVTESKEKINEINEYLSSSYVKRSARPERQ